MSYFTETRIVLLGTMMNLIQIYIIGPIHLQVFWFRITQIVTVKMESNQMALVYPEQMPWQFHQVRWQI